MSMSNFLKVTNFLAVPVRFASRSRFWRPYLKDLYLRRLSLGPEPFRPKSFWPEWNYEAELFAFEKRLGENFDKELLQQSLTDRSYASYMSSNSNVAEKDSSLKDNSELAIEGYSFTSNYCLRFLRHVYSKLPEEWVLSILNCLICENELSHIGAHLGLKDIILYTSDLNKDNSSGHLPINAPPSQAMIANCLLSIIGTLVKSGQTERAEYFIRDFILTHLVNIDILDEVLLMDNPMVLLSGILAKQNRGQPIPRLQFQTGINTMLACYQVGIYSDGEQIGQGTGETPDVAEYEAAAAAVRDLFGISENRAPLPLSGDLIEFPDSANHPNESIKVYINVALKLFADQRNEQKAE